MNNLRRDLDEIDSLISSVESADSATARYINAKKLRAKIDSLLKKLITEENDLVNIQLKKLK